MPGSALRLQTLSGGRRKQQEYVGCGDMSDSDRADAWRDTGLEVGPNEFYGRIRASDDVLVGQTPGGVLLTIAGVHLGVPVAQMEAALPAIRDAIKEAKRRGASAAETAAPFV